MQLNRSRLISSAAIILCVGVPPLARAQSVLPRGGSVAAGSVSIGAPAGNGLTVTQSSARGIINWNSFSVGQSNTVTFVQPNASSATLNRVTGSTTSTIAGQIRANGQVYLVNPNGIAITTTGAVKVGGGFVGSTLGITDQNFMDGKASFSGDGASAGVTNAGHIETRSKGFVALVGGTVDNSGTISVPLGKVGLGSGERATLDLTGDGFLQVAMPTHATAADGRGLVDVSGKVRAAGGSVELRAATVAGAIRNAVNVSGGVVATSVSGHDGAITLSAGDGGDATVSGELSVSGGKSAGGGTVVVTGHNVYLSPTARVDASGATGGTVLIGGDRQGGADASTKFVKHAIQTATTTRVAAGARILANGRTGAGGDVVVWSDDATRFAGAISARGAGRADGGFVETSAEGRLTVADGATVNTLASHGQAGDWLLDPATITIDVTGGATLTQAGHTRDTTSNITISTATLDGATSNVILSARTAIAVDSTISLYNNHVGITFEGAGTAAQIAAGPTRGITLATDVATSNGAILFKGAVKLANDVTIDSGNAPITITKGVTGPFFLMINTSGAINLAGPMSGLTGLTAAAAPTRIDGDISTTGAITFFGATTLDGNIATTNSSSTGTVTFYDVATLGGNISTRNAAVAFNNGVATKLIHDVAISSGTGAVTFSGTVDGHHTLSIANSGGTTFVGSVGGTIPLAGLTTGTGLTTFDTDVTTRNGPITVGGATAIGSTLTISAGTGAIGFAGAVDGVDQIGFELTVSNSGATKFGGTVGVTDTFNSLTTGTGTTTLDGNVKTGGDIVFNGPVVLGANVDIGIGNGFSTITFAKSVDGAFGLATNASGGVIFDGTIGATTALASLKSNVDNPTGPGPTTVNGGIVATGDVAFGGDAALGGNIATTNDSVTVNGATLLRHDVAITTGTGAIGFAGTIDGAHRLVLNSSGNMRIDGLTGSTTALAGLATGTGQISLDNNVVTTGAQIYGGRVRLLGPLIMDAGAADIRFAGTIRSAAAPVDFNSLTVMTSGLATFGGKVNLGGELLRTGNGSTLIAADITTQFNQFYDGAVTLLGDRTLRTGNADISFLSTIDTAPGASAPARLTVATGTGGQDYEGALGATNALGAVTLRSGDGISLADPTNNIGSVNIAARGAVTIADSGPLTVTGIVTTGDILVTTQIGNLTIAGAVTTTSVTATALVLEAGRTASRVASPGAADTAGNVVLDGGSLSVGAGGFGLIYTGSIVGSTGLSAAVDPGNFRYWSDTNGNTGYTTALTSGISAIYRERPAITVSTSTNGGRVYDGATTIPTLTTTGQVNGDAGSGTGTIVVTGAGSSLRNAGRYVIDVTNVRADALAGLGYTVRAGRGTYVITPATLTYTANGVTRSYGTTSPVLSGTVSGFVGGDSQANATTGRLIFTTVATRSSTPGAYAIDGGGLTANNGNYYFGEAPANATALTVTSLEFGSSVNAFLPPDLLGAGSIVSPDVAALALCSSGSIGETLVKQGSVVIFAPEGGCGSRPLVYVPA